MANENSFFIKTREKTPSEVDDFIDWLDGNYISYTYCGDLVYCIEGEGDATLVKLFWG